MRAVFDLEQHKMMNFTQWTESRKCRNVYLSDSE